MVAVAKPYKNVSRLTQLERCLCTLIEIGGNWEEDVYFMMELGDRLSLKQMSTDQKATFLFLVDKFMAREKLNKAVGIKKLLEQRKALAAMNRNSMYQQKQWNRG